MHVYIYHVCVSIYIYNYSHLVLTQQFYEVGRLIFISHMGKVRQRDIDCPPFHTINKWRIPRFEPRALRLLSAVVNPLITQCLPGGGKQLLT